MLTVDEVKRRVAAIEQDKNDDEAAHGSEDTLWENVLEAIAEGNPDGQALAIEALKTRAIDFARWYA